jgi:hypothetical protein
MRSAFDFVLSAAFAVALNGFAYAQSAVPPSSPTSAPAPKPAASTPIPARSAAVMAAENANEPGKLGPEERVIPQISVPLKPRNSAPEASQPNGRATGAIDDAAARCLATLGAVERAACQRGLSASGPRTSGR